MGSRWNSSDGSCKSLASKVLTRRTGPRTSDLLRRHGWVVTDSRLYNEDLETSTEVLVDTPYRHVTDICGGESDIETGFPSCMSAVPCQHNSTQGPLSPVSTIPPKARCPLSAQFYSRPAVLCQRHTTQGPLSPVSTIPPKVHCPLSAPFHRIVPLIHLSIPDATQSSDGQCS